MAFEPKGIFKATRLKEYKSYQDALADVLSMLSEHDNAHDVHDKVMKLMVEAGDDFPD